MSLQLVPELTLGPVYTSTKKSPSASSSTNGGATFATATGQATFLSSGLWWPVPLRKAETPLCFMLCCVLMSRRCVARKLRSGTAGAWAWPLREQ
jgi:hypothetical protein